MITGAIVSCDTFKTKAYEKYQHLTNLKFYLGELDELIYAMPETL